ncbi:MAG: hypothetical protein AB8G15_05760 [Saprospiraceae bacterium]
MAIIILIRILNTETNKVEVEVDEKPCVYCGYQTVGRFLCGNCNSILWYKLQKASWLLPTAIFILSHRWAVIVALTSAFLIGPAYSLIEKRSTLQRTEEILQAQNKKALNLILDDLSIVRSKIINLEMTTDSVPYDMKEWNTLHTLYTKIYWNIVPVFEQLLESTLEKNESFKTAFKNIKKPFDIIGTFYMVRNENTVIKDTLPTKQFNISYPTGSTPAKNIKRLKVEAKIFTISNISTSTQKDSSYMEGDSSYTVIATVTKIKDSLFNIKNYSQLKEGDRALTMRDTITKNASMEKKMAFLLKHPQFDIAHVDKFITYLKKVKVYQQSKKKEDKHERKKAANELYHALRTSSILIRSLIDSKWILKDNGRYPSNAADDKFYFDAMFNASDTTAIRNLDYNYGVREIEAFEIKE